MLRDHHSCSKGVVEIGYITDDYNKKSLYHNSIVDHFVSK